MTISLKTSMLGHRCSFVFTAMTLLILLLLGATARAVDFERLRDSTSRAEDTFVKASNKIVEGVLEDYEKAIRMAAKAGNLEVLEELKEEQRAFQTKHTLPKSLDTLAYRQRLCWEMEKCIIKYNEAIATATKQGELQLANQLQAKRDSFEQRFDQE